VCQGQQLLTGLQVRQQLLHCQGKPWVGCEGEQMLTALHLYSLKDSMKQLTGLQVRLAGCLVHLVL
jgi:hypothetical protein